MAPEKTLLRGNAALRRGFLSVLGGCAAGGPKLAFLCWPLGGGRQRGRAGQTQRHSHSNKQRRPYKGARNGELAAKGIHYELLSDVIYSKIPNIKGEN